MFNFYLGSNSWGISEEKFMCETRKLHFKMWVFLKQVHDLILMFLFLLIISLHGCALTLGLIYFFRDISKQVQT